MTNYRDRGTDRYKDGSLKTNQAEAWVEAWLDHAGKEWYRYGLDGVPTEKALAFSWPSFVRHTPDYLLRGQALEVKACGSTHLTLKHQDLEAAQAWDQHLPVLFACVQFKENRILIADVQALAWAAEQPGTETMTLDAGKSWAKPAYRIPVQYLEEQLVANVFKASTVYGVKRK